jgi:hypothetical protein
MKRYDVFIVHRETRKIDTIIGKDMLSESEGGYYSAEKRAETGWSRINHHYTIAVAPAGKFKVEEVLPISEEVDL